MRSCATGMLAEAQRNVCLYIVMMIIQIQIQIFELYKSVDTEFSINDDDDDGVKLTSEAHVWIKYVYTCLY